MKYMEHLSEIAGNNVKNLNILKDDLASVPPVLAEYVSFYNLSN